MDKEAPDGLADLLARQRAAFAREPHRAAALRRQDLRRLETLVDARADTLIQAMAADFGGRSAQESLLLDLIFTIRSARHARRRVAEWMADRRVATPLALAPGRAFVRYEPKGVVGIIAPWNYPVQLALGPAIGALAAGCRIIIKPSEQAPRTAYALQSLLAEAFPEDQVAVAPGDAETAARLAALPLDHLVFTGSTRVGRLVAQAAAENLTPLTLELGGKSPAVLDPAYPADAAMAAIAWGRLLNGGQTCVAPDFMVTVGGPALPLAERFLDHACRLWPGFEANPDYTALISQAHFDRLQALVDEAANRGATVLQPPHDREAARASRRFPPTAIIDPPMDARVMREEIFGPVLPVLSRPSLEAALELSPTPLALYVFSRDRRFVETALRSSRSGGVTVNGVLLHVANDHLPFGGVGGSGRGAYHGRRGFEEFSHARAVFHAPAWHPSQALRPPYGRKHAWLSGLLARL